MHKSFVIAVAATVAFLTIQAAYWPLVVNPSTKLQFWQMHWAAEIGYRLGAPVVGAVLFSTLTGLAHEILLLGLAILWSAAVAWVASVGLHNFNHPAAKKTTARVTAPLTPAAATPTKADSAVQTPAHLARSAAPPSAPSD